MQFLSSLDRYTGPDANFGSLQSLPFSYSINNLGTAGGLTLRSSEIYPCTHPAVSGYAAGVTGYPMWGSPPYPWGAADQMASLGSLIAAKQGGMDETFVPDYATIGMCNNQALFTGPNTWDVSLPIDNRWSTETNYEPYAMLHSLTVYGGVGIVYLVDLVCVMDISLPSMPLDQWFVFPTSMRYALSQSAPYRGGRSLRVAFGTTGQSSARDQALHSPTFGGHELLFAVSGHHEDDVTYIDWAGRPVSWGGWGHIPSATDSEMPAGNQPASFTQDPTAPYGSLRSEGTVANLVGMKINSTIPARYMYIYDVIATVEIPTTHGAVTVGLASGLYEKISYYSALGIMFQPSEDTTASVLLQGRVNLLV